MAVVKIKDFFAVLSTSSGLASAAPRRCSIWAISLSNAQQSTQQQRLSKVRRPSLSTSASSLPRSLRSLCRVVSKLCCATSPSASGHSASVSISLLIIRPPKAINAERNSNGLREEGVRVRGFWPFITLYRPRYRPGFARASYQGAEAALQGLGFVCG